MLAAVLVAPGRFELRQVPRPNPGPAEVSVRIEGCGFSAPMRSPWSGPLRCPLAPGAPGREAWGVIDAVGSEVDGWRPGERVGLLSRHGYAEYGLATPGGLVRLPEGLWGQPFLAEPLAGAVNVFRRSAIHKGETVAIVGIGFLGALMAQLAALAEARVIAVSRRGFALEVARRFGAEAVFSPAEAGGKGGVARAVHRITGGALCDLVIEAAGRQEALDLAGELARDRGRLLIAGHHHEAPRRVDLRLWSWRGLDVINAHERSPALCREGMREAAAAVEAGLITPAPLYTHRLPPERINEALRLSTERPDGFMKALIEF